MSLFDAPEDPKALDFYIISAIVAIFSIGMLCGFMLTMVLGR